MILAAAAALIGAAPLSPAQQAADSFFTRPELGETRAVVVLKDGVPVYERYGRGYGPGNRFISWSMAKSLTATLVGQLVAEGKLQLDTPAPVAEWHAKPGDPRAAITLRQLLHMSSGLNHEEGGERLQDADTVRILYTDRAGDAAGASIAQPLEAKPGAKYEYSTATSVILADIVQRTVAPNAKTPAARRAAMRAHIESRLARPAGMSSLVCEYDATGTMLGGSLCHASARDWAKFGQLYLDGGKGIVPAEWVSFVQAPAATDGGYGGHFWLNRPRPKGSAQALFPEAGPADAYAAIGHLGQYVIVVPSKRLVVVRLGKTQDDVLAPVRQQLARLVAAYPAVP
ncbi:serine hydrolase domain-containing protein [Sphingoaurantiacus capsulatus]|uniref:Serine hydrolase domain-containing protein n=1 Tax=Sphingoaurantiacus capsulatus TaxID=1771310 RepID=A0ABV7XD07_9SPHN